MAFQLRMTQEQARQLNDRVIEMLLEGEDPGRLLELLDRARIEED